MYWRPSEYPERLQRFLTVNGEVQTSEEATVYVHDLQLFLTLTDPRGYATSSIAWKTLRRASGQKTHLTQNDRKTNATRRTMCQSLSQHDPQVLPVRVQVRLLHRYRRTRLMILRQQTTRRETTSIPVLGNELRDSSATLNTNKNRVIVPAPGNRFRDLSQWSQELTEHPGDEGALASRDTPANTSQDSNSERPVKVVSRKYPYSLPERENAKYARDPRLQGLLAGNAPVKQYLEQKTLVT